MVNPNPIHGLWRIVGNFVDLVGPGALLTTSPLTSPWDCRCLIGSLRIIMAEMRATLHEGRLRL